MANFNRNITALEAVSRAMQQLGLVTTAPVIANGSTDPTVSQIWVLLQQAGLEILEDWDWQFLQKTHTIVTTPPTVNYPLPEDFSGFYNDASWNMTSLLPVQGSLTPQIWRMLQARNLGNQTFTIQYIVQNDELIFYTPPATAQTLTFEYKSRGWVRSYDNAAVYRDQPQNDADIIMFNPNLIVAKLKLMWRKAKGFDPTAAENDYAAALETAKGRDVPGMTLSTVQAQEFPYLGYYNIPDTGYGS